MTLLFFLASLSSRYAVPSAIFCTAMVCDTVFGGLLMLLHAGWRP